MKKLTYFISVSLTYIFLSRPACAMWPDFTPLMPVSPQFCAMCIPPAIDYAYSTYDQVMSAKDRLKEMTDVTKIKQYLASYAAPLGNTLLNKITNKLSSRKRVVSYSRTILESKREGVDIRKEDSIKADFVNLFLQYPDTKNKMKSVYRSKGNSIKIDTALEMYITATEMTKELCGEGGLGCEKVAKLGANPDEKIDIAPDKMGMLLQVSIVERCLMEGKYCDELGLIGCGGKTSGSSGGQPTEAEDNEEDAVCHWKSALQVARIYDKIMRYNEYLSLIESQYEAVMGIDGLAKIREADEEKIEDDKNNEGAFLLEKYLPAANNYAYSVLSDSFAFADEKLSDDDASLAAYSSQLNRHENVMTGNFEEIKEAKGFESVLDDKKDDVESLSIIESVKRSLNEAKLFHNMKQMLPDYAKTFRNYHDAQEYHDKTIQFLQQSGECVKDFLGTYYEDAAKAWFGKGCDYFGDGMIYCHYQPEKEVTYDTGKMTEEYLQSAGLFDEFCPDNKNAKCYVMKLQDSEFSSGIAGVLLAYYTQGKIDDALEETSSYLTAGEKEIATESEKVSSNAYTAQVNVLNEDTTIEDKDTYVTGRDNSDIVDMENASPSTLASASSSRSSGSIETNLKDPADGDALNEETRKSSLMNWVWGSAVIGEISADLDSASPKFGARRKKFPLWNDQREFYEQYIDGKYSNIKTFIEEAPMADVLLNVALGINTVYPYEPIRNELGAIIMTVDTIRNKTETGLMSLNDIANQEEVDVRAQIAAVIASEDATLNALKKSHEQTLKKLEQEKDTLMRLLQTINSNLSEVNEEYNAASQAAATASNNAKSSKDGEQYGRELLGKYKTPISFSDSPINKEFASSRTESEEARIAAKAKRDGLLSQSESLERNSELTAKNLEQKKKEIEKERRDFVKRYSDTEIDLREKFGTFISQYNAPTITDKSFIGQMTGQSVRPYAANISGALVECVRSYASQEVEKAKQKIDALKAGDKLYYIENANQVQNIHAEMIANITNVPFSACASVFGVNISGAEEIAQPALTMFAKYCEDDKCSVDDEYFIGGVGMKDDLTAPKAPVDFTSAPLREVFHMDMVDYNNIDKYYEKENKIYDNRTVTITADGFLNSGLEIPEIWKHLLSRHTYVQKQFDLSRLLGSAEFGDSVRGAPIKSYLRSGAFPCQYDGKTIDVGASLNTSGTATIISKLGYTVNKTDDKSLYPTVDCRGFSITKYKGADKVIDYVVGGGIMSSKLSSTGSIDETSELGNILAYMPDIGIDFTGIIGHFKTAIDLSKEKRKLTFNPAFLRAIQTISETEDLGKNEEEDAAFYLSNRSLFSRNQLGDYLNQVEQEAIARETLLRVENQISDIREDLKDIFYGTSMIITEEFDLVNEDDYKSASEALDEQKSIYLEEAKRELSKVKGNSASLKNKAEALLNIISVLEQDSDEIVYITGNENPNDLSARIANKKADNALSGQYDDMAKEAHQRRMRDLQPPYCLVSPI